MYKLSWPERSYEVVVGSFGNEHGVRTLGVGIFNSDEGLEITKKLLAEKRLLFPPAGNDMEHYMGNII